MHSDTFSEQRRAAPCVGTAATSCVSRHLQTLEHTVEEREENLNLTLANRVTVRTRRRRASCIDA
eukprot:6200507-Pleurochrysis_carterae.AAC.2